MRYFYFLFFSLLLVPVGYAQYWESLGGPGEGVVGTMLGPNGDIYLFSQQQIHRSTDQGITWLPFVTNIPITNPILVWSPSGNVYTTQSNRLQKSTDGGHTWAPIRATGNAFVATTPQGYIVVAEADSVSTSSDEGATWKSTKPSGNSKLVAVNLSADTEGTLYLSTQYGYFFRSTDNGLTWSRMVNGLPFYDAPLQIASTAPGLVYATLGTACYKTLDRGRTWQELAMFTRNYRFIVATASNVILLFDQGGSSARSTDGGKTWDTYRYLQNTYAVFISGDNVFSASYPSLYKRNILATDDEEWQLVPTPSAQVTHVATTPTREIYAATRMFGVGNLWKFVGEIWHKDTNFKQVPIIELAADSIGTIGGVFNKMYNCSTDKGTTWNESLSVPQPGVAKFAASRSDQYMLTNEGVFHSDDRGLSWDVTQTLTTMDFTTTSTLAIAQDILYLGGLSSFFRSTDKGVTWETPDFPFILGSGIVRSIAAVGAQLIVGVDRTGAYFSSDRGLTWENHSEGLMMDTINQVLMTPKGPVFAATNSGVYEYSPSTKVWKNVDDNTLGGKAFSLSLGADGKVYVGTEGAGVYRTTNTYGTWYKAGISRPVSDKLQLYPNPASTTITVNLDADIPNDFTISIYDVLGVCRLTSTGEQTLNISALANGQYVVRIEVGDKLENDLLTIVR